MIRIAIAGPPGSEKSTVRCNVLKQLACIYGGMTSADIRVKGERVGFEIKDITTGKQGILAHKRGSGPHVGSYHVNLEDLNGIGVYTVTLENRENLELEISLKINKAFSK
jgi:nucleoside-triphosphatase